MENFGTGSFENIAPNIRGGCSLGLANSNIPVPGGPPGNGTRTEATTLLLPRIEYRVVYTFSLGGAKSGVGAYGTKLQIVTPCVLTIDCSSCKFHGPNDAPCNVKLAGHDSAMMGACSRTGFATTQVDISFGWCDAGS